MRPGEVIYSVVTCLEIILYIRNKNWRIGSSAARRRSTGDDAGHPSGGSTSSRPASRPHPDPSPARSGLPGR